MGKINWGRVILGGLLAGVVMDLMDYVVHTYVIAAQDEAAMKALGVHLVPGAIPIFLVEGLVLGIAAIWAYAAARPRYGAGAKTAIITAVGVWVIGDLLPNVGNWAAGISPVNLFWIGTLLGLVELIVASLVGAALYREA
jgi:hypothetical protein